MPKLVFKVAADYEKVQRLRDEISSLKSEMGTLEAKSSRPIMESLTTRLSEAKNEMSLLSTEAAKTGMSIENEFKKKIFDASQVVNTLSGKIIEQKDVIRNTQNDISILMDKYKNIPKYSKSGTEVFSEISAARKVIDEQKYALFQLNQEQSKARLSVRSLKDEYASFSKESNNTSNVIKDLAGRFAAVFTINKAVGFAKEIAVIRGDFQKLEVAFETMLGSKQKADILMGELVKTAATTPFDLQGVSNGAKQLLAYGESADNVNGILVRLGNIAAGLSIPLNDIVYLYGTTMTEGRLYAKDMRQFLGRGIPLADELAKQFGVTKQRISEMVTAGKIGFPEVKKAIESMTNEGGKFANLMEKQSKTIAGQISNLGDAWSVMLNDIGKNSEGFISGSLTATKSLIENYDKVANILGTLVATYGAYRAALIAVSAIDAIKNTQSIAIAYMNLAKAIRSTAVAQSALNIVTSLSPWAAVIGIIVGAGTALYLFRDKTDYAKKGVEELNIKLNEQKDAYNELVSTVKNEIKSTVERQAALEKLKKIHPEIWNSITLQTAAQVKLNEATAQYGKIVMQNSKEELKSLIQKSRNKIESLEQQGKNGTSGSSSSIMYMIDRETKNMTSLQSQLREIYKQEADARDLERKAASESSDENKKKVKSLSELRKELKNLKEEQESVTSKDEYNSIEKKKKDVTSQIESITGASKGTLKTQRDIERSIREFNEYVIESQLKSEAARISAMKDGKEKRLAILKQEYEETIAQINKKRNEKLSDKNLSSDKKASINITADNQISVEQSKYNASVEKENRDTAKVISDIQRDVTNRLATELENRLSDIDSYYAETIKKAKESGESETGEFISKLRRQRDAEKELSKNEDKIKKVDFRQEIAISSLDAQRTGGSYNEERIEREKTQTFIRFGQERLSILKQMGDEQSNQEAANLENQLKVWDNSLKKPKPLFKKADEAIVNSIAKQYEKMGMSSDKAKEKAETFADLFSQKMGDVADVTNFLKDSLGGISPELDMALDAVSNIAQGFAQGGLVGGISAAAGQLISITTNLLTAKKEISAEMKAEYEAYMSIVDKLVDTNIDLLDKLSTAAFGKQVKETIKLIETQVKASQKLFSEAQTAGAGVFSSSDGYKFNKVLKEANMTLEQMTYLSKLLPGYQDKINESYKNQLPTLRELGIQTEEIGKMSTSDLRLLREKRPDLWAKMSEDLRKYAEAILDAEDKLNEFNQQIQDMILGFQFSDITDMIIDSFTDSSIDNALEDFSGKIDDVIGGIVKNMLQKKMLVGPMQTMVDDLYKSMEKKDSNGNLSYEITTENAKKFKDNVLSLGEQFGDAWKVLEQQFGGAGIEISGSQKDKSASASIRAMQGLSQETGGAIEGRMAVIQGYSYEQLNENRSLTATLQRLTADFETIGIDMSKYLSIADDARSIAVNTYLEVKIIRENTDNMVKPIKQIADDIAVVRKNSNNWS